MADKIRERIVDAIDIKCDVAGCNCKRTVTAAFVKAGVYSANEENCSACKHSNRDHRVLGQAKSMSEKRRAKKRK